MDSAASALFGVSAGDLLWLALIAVAAGLVRGFSGFGSALVYIPLAATMLEPIWVIVTLTVMDLVGPLPNLPAAIRSGRPREVALLGAVAGMFLLPGLWALDRLDDAAFRLIVATLCLGSVALMASGWRRRGGTPPALLMAGGAASGFLGGVSGLAGPPVILLYMSSASPVASIRANILMYLVLWDAILMAVLGMQGRLSVAPLALGAALIAPYLIANVIGARLFRPGRERLYRRAAYVVISAAALSALPVWSPQ